MKNLIKVKDELTVRQMEFVTQLGTIERVNNYYNKDGLVTHLKEIGFFTAPCSTQYHSSFEGGLLEHSLLVTEVMLRINEVNNIATQGISTDSIKIVGLLHDVGKAQFMGKDNYVPNILKSGRMSAAKPYTNNPDRLYMPHEVVSISIISPFIDLTEDEMFAILYHNGLYTPLGRLIQGKETPLQQLLHFADMWCSRFMEA